MMVIQSPGQSSLHHQVNDVCRAYDYSYSKAKNKADKHRSDKEMLSWSKEIKT